MVLEKGGPSDVDTLRKEALRKRVLAQEWAGTAMQELVTQVGAIASSAHTGAVTAETVGQAEQALSLCDRVRAASEVAVASIRVANEEGLDLAADTARIEAQAAREELTVQQLRRQLERETRAVAQRDQLEAAAKVVLQLPEPAALAQQLAAARREAARVQAEIDRVDQAKAAVAREIALLLQCAAAAGDQAVRIDALLADGAATSPPQTPTATGAADAAAAASSLQHSKMDTSD